MISQTDFADELNRDAPEVSPGKRLGQYLMQPQIFFNDVASRPRWLFAYALMVVMAVAANLVLGPLIGRVSLQAIQPSPSPERLELLRHSMLMVRIIGVIVLPLSQLISLVSVTFLTWVAICITSAIVPFRTVLSIVGYASIPNVLDRLLGATSNYIGGYADGISDVSDIRAVSVSLADLMHSENSFFAAGLHQITVFYLWSLVLLVIGLFAATREKQKTAVLASVIGTQAIIILGISAFQSIAHSFHS